MPLLTTVFFLLAAIPLVHGQVSDSAAATNSQLDEYGTRASESLSSVCTAAFSTVSLASVYDSSTRAIADHEASAASLAPLAALRHPYHLRGPSSQRLHHRPTTSFVGSPNASRGSIIVTTSSPFVRAPRCSVCEIVTLCI